MNDNIGISMNEKKRVILYAGTTEGRVLATMLSAAGVDTLLCVATEYGRVVLSEMPHIEVRTGRQDEAQMYAEITDCGCELVVDATHPFATAVTENIRRAAKKAGREYIRVARDTKAEYIRDNVLSVSSVEECVKALENTNGNIMLTTGSKELGVFVDSGISSDRLYVRVLPGLESLKICKDLGIEGKQVIAMQGPFSEELNIALMKQYDIKHLVTKESGANGGFPEKLSAAGKLGVNTYVIKNPEMTEDNTGYATENNCINNNGNNIQDNVQVFDMKTAVYEIAKLLEINYKPKINIRLIGTGMGALSMLTQQAVEAIEEADYIIGAGRLIESTKKLAVHAVETKPYYKAEDIVAYIERLYVNLYSDIKVVVLFSGDTGFYSGCKSVYEALMKLDFVDANVLPGVSSISMMAARFSTSWQDAHIESLHGVAEADFDSIYKGLVNEQCLKYNKTFLLLSGRVQLIRLLERLTQVLDIDKICIGYQLSYENERLYSGSTQEILDMRDELKDGLYAMLIYRKNAYSTECEEDSNMQMYDKEHKAGISVDDVEKNSRHTYDKEHLSGIGADKNRYLRDEQFIRGKVPMTKEEIRHLVISKLRLADDSVLYDIGCGTGSISCEAAAVSHGIKVYAMDASKEAISLTRQNAQALGLSNISVTEGAAPEALDKLPMATHAFIGGSGGRLKDILERLYSINPHMRVVIDAVSMETVAELSTIEEEFNVVDMETVVVQVSRLRKLGSYHMPKAENPVYICCFEFCGI